MKQGKKPTLNQRKFIESQNLDSREWLVTKDTPERMEIVHREDPEMNFRVYVKDS